MTQGRHCYRAALPFPVASGGPILLLPWPDRLASWVYDRSMPSGEKATLRSGDVAAASLCRAQYPPWVEGTRQMAGRPRRHVAAVTAAILIHVSLIAWLVLAP